MKTALASVRKNVKADANPMALVAVTHLAQMAAMRPAKRAVQTTAKADAMRAADVYAQKEATEKPAPTAAIPQDVPAVTSNAKMDATSMARVPAQAAANMDATTTAHASPTPLGANTAPIQITAIACVRIPAPMVATPKVNHAAARSPAQTAVMRPALNVAVRQAVPTDLHATI